MTIWNLGSVNADLVYRLPHLPAPGETLAAITHQRGLGGKGANMSVAAARAGSHVKHIGAVGKDGVWMRERLSEYGVDVGHLAIVDVPSGHAIVALDAAQGQEGENLIIIHPGANIMVDSAKLGSVLAKADPGDIAIFQNETNAQLEFARLAKGLGLRVCYAAAPFSVDAVSAVLEFLDLLVLNEIEAEQLQGALGQKIEDLPVADIVVTLGKDGCRWVHQGQDARFDAPKVKPVDTTGAGDTFTGYLLAELDRGLRMSQAIETAQKAGAVMVTRLGTADVIPTKPEIENFFESFET